MSERETQLVAVIKDLIEAGDGIRCYPSGAVGFDEWYEAQARAQDAIGEFHSVEGYPLGHDVWHPIEKVAGPTPNE